VPAGIWLTGLISLKDNIDLHLERNALIVMSPDKRDLIKTTDGKLEAKASPAITASKRKNVSITGQGIIDGNGEYWRPVKRSKMSDAEWNQYLSRGGTVSEKGDLWYPFNLKHYPNVGEPARKQERMRAHLVRFTDCENVLVQGVTLRNSPNFHLVPSVARMSSSTASRWPAHGTHRTAMPSTSATVRMCSSSTMSSMPVTTASA
jgi:polygalacturonase